MALGGRRFININNNQIKDGVDIRGCVGEEARSVQNVWGGRLLIVWGGILIDEKNSKMGGPLALVLENIQKQDTLAGALLRPPKTYQYILGEK